MNQIRYPHTSIQRVKNKRNSMKAIFGFCFLVVFGLAGTSYVLNAQEPLTSQVDVQERLRQIQTQLQSLNNDIQKAQTEANKTPAVREALLKYSAALTEEMKKIEPEKTDLIEEREALYLELLEITVKDNRSSADEEKLQSLGQRFNSVRQELNLVEAQANQRDATQQAFQAYNETITAEMAKIDPEIPQKIEEREKLMQEFTNLRNALQSR